MNTDKPKINRGELLAKARAVKAAKAEAAKAEAAKAEKAKDIIVEPEPVEVAELIEPVKKSKAKKTVEVKKLERENSNIEPEIVEQVVKIPASKKKRVVKRTIEIEESDDTEEEIEEQIVRIPKVKNNVKFSREEMKNKLYQMNQQRLAAELFS
jgi:hypothetical protein